MLKPEKVIGGVLVEKVQHSHSVMAAITVQNSSRLNTKPRKQARFIFVLVNTVKTVHCAMVPTTICDRRDTACH